MLKENLLKNEKVKPNSREIELLKQNFPQFFSKEGEFLLEKFKEMLKMEDVKIDKEGYELKFLGKNYARFLTSTETETVIVPNVKHNEEEINKNSENLYIIGDNLDALKHLLNSYSGKIKCIYIDPPYNTGSDGFIYNDNFEYTPENISEKMGIELEEAQRIIEMRGKSTHSAWLTFMYTRLVLARDLLREDGVIFISIDDNEQANLKMVCDEIFGEENFVGELPTIMNLKGNNDEFGFSGTHEFTIVYAREKNFLELNNFPINEEELEDWEEDEFGKYKRGANLKSTGTNAPREKRPNLFFPIYIDDNDDIFVTEDNNKPQKFNGNLITLYPITDEQEMSWRWSKSKFKNELENIIVSRSKNVNIYKKQRPMLGDLPSKKPKTLFYKPEYSSGNGTIQIKSLFNKKLFSNPKPIELLKDFIILGGNKNLIILDFFSGSATTAHAVMQLNAEDGGNRKYIMVQLPEKTYEEKINKEGEIIFKAKKGSEAAYKAGYKTIDEIGIERIKRAAKKIKEETQAEIDYGFKIVKLETPNSNTLDKIVDFNPDDNKLILDNFIDEFKFGETEGYDTILTTWLNQDGYGMNVKSQKVLLKNFEIDIFENSAYIIKEGISSEDIMELITRVEKNEIAITRLVVYPYSVPFNVLHEMKRNFKNLRGNKELKLIERY